MASRVGAFSTADVGRIAAEARRRADRSQPPASPPSPALQPTGGAGGASGTAIGIAGAAAQRREFELHYTISNNGDGSVSLRQHRSATAARRADAASGEPFAEPTAGCITLRISADGASIEVEGAGGTWAALSPTA